MFNMQKEKNEEPVIFYANESEQLHGWIQVFPSRTSMTMKVPAILSFALGYSMDIRAFFVPSGSNSHFANSSNSKRKGSDEGDA